MTDKPTDLYEQHRHEQASALIQSELKKEIIVKSCVKEGPGLVIPQEIYFIAEGPDHYSKPYRIQERQFGHAFYRMPDLKSQLTRKNVATLKTLIDATLFCYNEYGFHLDLIGFISNHTPTLFDIFKAYLNPFQKATNLLLRPDTVIAWVDAKTSNLTPAKNALRTILLIVEKMRLSKIN